MTLILTIQTPWWNAITSDRMLSDLRGRTNSTNTVKIVQYFNDIVFGYTGISKLPYPNGKLEDTARYFAQLLLHGNRLQPIETLAAVRTQIYEAMERLYRANPKLPNIPLAILGVGFERDKTNAGKVSNSFTATISNFHAADGKSVDYSNPRREFNLIVSRDALEILDTKGAFFKISWVGYPQTQDELQWLAKNLDKAFQSKNCTAIQVVDIMKQSIRQTSNRLKGKFVGADILAAIVPVQAAVAAHVAAVGPQANSGVSFDNNPDDLTKIRKDECPVFVRFHPGRDTGVYCAPHIVATHFANFQCWAPKGIEFSLKGKVLHDNGGHIILLAGAELRLKNRNKNKKKR